MRVAVTGSQGQLGHDVMKVLASHGHEGIGLTREQADIRDADRIISVLNDMKPDAVIHCAAYTAVDDAEDQVDTAWEINTLGTKHIAQACKGLDIPMIYISTDYVFDGSGELPFEITAKRNPINVYGKTKAEGEAIVEELLHKFFIVRISWVFGLHGNNFVKTMLRIGKHGNPIRVVSDQVGSPTYTVDVAQFLMGLLTSDQYGIYHATNSGFCSWYDFAKKIFELEGMSSVIVEPVKSTEYVTKAKRPLNSRLKNESNQKGFNLLPPWEDALRRFIEELHNNNTEPK